MDPKNVSFSMLEPIHACFWKGPVFDFFLIAFLCQKKPDIALPEMYICCFCIGCTRVFASCSFPCEVSLGSKSTSKMTHFGLPKSNQNRPEGLPRALQKVFQNWSPFYVGFGPPLDPLLTSTNITKGPPISARAVAPR